MLKSLNIENIAIIEKCNIDFCDGFNVLTGETGAGKSIIIDSINAVTGMRTSKELVRTGSDKATVSALFDNVPKKCAELLENYGVTLDDGSVFMLRTITADGRNTCKINGVTVSVGILREVGEYLVNIHGQHDNQALLNPELHCMFLDLYGEHGTVIEDYKECYHSLKSVKKTIKELKTDDEQKQKLIDFLNFQINEIEAADISVGELETLLKRREVIRNAEKLREGLLICYNGLIGDEDTSGAASLCEEAVNGLNMCSGSLENAKTLLERLQNVNLELYDITSEVRGLLDGVSFDEGELEETEQRIDVIRSLMKKYGGSEETVLEFFETSKAKLDKIYRSDEELLKAEQLYSEIEDQLIEKGAVLTEKRKKTAEKFSRNICDVLKYLEMPNVVFSVNIEEDMYTVNGCDNVEFYISANSGQAVKPLCKVASGGELSRIMLSIKSVMNRVADADTLIFDEIDTGISGKAADKVGRQLKALSSDRQVLCVTHLAQIAAAADNHLLITKSTKNGNTFTDVAEAKGDTRVNEIARIMSGGEMTESLLKSAKELIENHAVM
jgi:DNA repair protein RecN (Recombination protein N)